MNPHRSTDFAVIIGTIKMALRADMAIEHQKEIVDPITIRIFFFDKQLISILFYNLSIDHRFRSIQFIKKLSQKRVRNSNNRSYLYA